MVAKFRPIDHIPNEAEYNTLRNEIISEMEMQTHLRIAMVTVSVSILSLAQYLEASLLFVSAIVVLIPFFLFILNKQLNILRISAYIILRFENKFSNLRWQSTAIKMEKNLSKLSVIFIYVTRVGNYISVILSIVIACFYYFSTNIRTTQTDKIVFILLVIIILLNILNISNNFFLDKFKQAFEKTLSE